MEEVKKEREESSVDGGIVANGDGWKLELNDFCSWRTKNDGETSARYVCHVLAQKSSNSIFFLL